MPEHQPAIALSWVREADRKEYGQTSRGAYAAFGAVRLIKAN